MTPPPSRATPAGRAYLDLRSKARSDRRPVDELMQLYVLEAFLARVSGSRYAERLVLKGGVLLAAFGERRPTRDVDLHAHALDNDAEHIQEVICDIAFEDLDDGVVFDVHKATSMVIRDEDAYSGVRVTMQAEMATARPHFHVDVNVGDPISPAPENVRLPRLLGGEIVLRGYPLVMVYAEKIVTAIARGTVSTRWRDFADMYLLSRRHGVAGRDMTVSVQQVADHRRVELASGSDPRRLRGDRAGSVGHLEKEAATGGPSAGVLRRGGLDRRRVRGPGDQRRRDEPVVGPENRSLVMKIGESEMTGAPLTDQPRRPGSQMLVGRWRIVEMDLWEQDDVDLVAPGFIEFGKDRMGSLNPGWFKAQPSDPSQDSLPMPVTSTFLARSEGLEPPTF